VQRYIKKNKQPNFKL